MNHRFLEKVWYLLSNAGLLKSFWVEDITYTNQLIKRLPLSTIGGKTPIKV